ncbi:MAG TPA: aminopeptidase [Thermodesulfovibrionales bacterium]|nr:aminopeptidase [Thermodesulfovibrionales bacterium]
MLTDSIKAIYTINLGVKREEKVLVFTDRISERELIDAKDQCRRERLRDIALLTAEIGKSFAKKVIFHEYPSNLSHGAEPHEELWRFAFGEKAVKDLDKSDLLAALLSKKISEDGIKKAEAIINRNRNSCVNAIIALSNYSTSHTRFRDFLTRVCGSRYASMPLFDASMFEGAMDVDWRELAKRTTTMATLVNRAEEIKIKTRNGTHLSLSKRGRKALSDTGILTKPGSFGNLPAGEVYLAPLEGTAKGELVLDWAPMRELESPVKLIVRDGFVVGVEGEEPYAEVLKAKLNDRKENANIAELGIGTNEKARRPDNILESEKILGTIHIALGDNSSFGGNVQASFHQDFVFFKPTVLLINKDGTKTTLMKDGKFEGIKK